MNYALAKQLKEAGYPQKPKDRFSSNQYTYSDDDNDGVYEPNLGELIEACGDRFDDVRRVYAGEFVAETIGVEPQIGKTPEIAVAKLWLELKKKNDSNR